MATIKKILCAIDLTKASDIAFDRPLLVSVKPNSTSFTRCLRTCRFHGEPATGSDC